MKIEKRIRRFLLSLSFLFIGMMMSSLFYNHSDNWKWQLIIVLSCLSIVQAIEIHFNE